VYTGKQIANNSVLFGIEAAVSMVLTSWLLFGHTITMNFGTLSIITVTAFILIVICAAKPNLVPHVGGIGFGVLIGVLMGGTAAKDVVNWEVSGCWGALFLVTLPISYGMYKVVSNLKKELTSRSRFVLSSRSLRFCVRCRSSC
jgi:hypothetical protein